MPANAVMIKMPHIDCRTTTGNSRCPYLAEYKRSPEGKIYSYRNLFVCEFMNVVLEHLIDHSDSVGRTITDVLSPWDCDVRQKLRKEGQHPRVVTIEYEQ